MTSVAAIASRRLVARHHGSFIPLACTQITAPTGWPFAVTRASRSLHARPPLPTHSAAGLVKPSFIGDMDVATETNDVVEAKFVEVGKQLLVAEPTIGQDRDPASRRHQFGQPQQAGIFKVIALVLQFFFPHAQPSRGAARPCPVTRLNTSVA